MALECIDNVIYSTVDDDWEKDYLHISDADKSVSGGGTEDIKSIVMQFART